jgi:serine/threonine protein kinase
MAPHLPKPTMTGTVSCYTMGSTNTEATMVGTAWDQRLHRALNNMRIASPPRPFAGRYLLLQERAGGSQAVIAFARDRDGGFFQYAIKFFRHIEDFEAESELYRNPQLRKALPQVFHGGDNANGALKSPGGFVFPPFLVLERGAPLPTWRKEHRSFPSVLNMFHDLAMQLDRVHQADYVHLDLKPDNVLLMLQTQVWKLIDFGISKRIGALHTSQTLLLCHVMTFGSLTACLRRQFVPVPFVSENLMKSMSVFAPAYLSSCTSCVSTAGNDGVRVQEQKLIHTVPGCTRLLKCCRPVNAGSSSQYAPHRTSGRLE